jgi:TatD DNase family protein
MFVDSHCHLNYPKLVERQAEVLANARTAGVSTMLNISTRAAEWDAVIGTAEREPDVWASVGIHPHDADTHEDIETAMLVEKSRHPRVIGIGETGLDFHYDLSPRDVQASVFRAHVAAARQTGLPLVVHTREADQVMGDILEEEHAQGPFKILMHCYTSGADLAKRMAALGAWFSVSGIATFKQAQDVRDIIADMPEDRIILETDCPYLAPVPMRGRRNEPAYLPHVLDKLAEIRGWTRAEAEQRTEDAFFALFDRIPRS